MSTGVPWAPAIAAAYTAASLAKTNSIISNLKSQSFSGGGSQPSAGSAPAVGASASGVPQSAGQAGVSQSIVLNIDPDAIITGRGLVDMLNEAAANGANISVAGE